MKTTQKGLTNEVLEAYADCWNTGEDAYKRRNLNFKASVFTDWDNVKALLSKAIPHGYNNFSAKLLNLFPKTAKFKIAREGSACLYVKGANLPSKEAVLADEYSVKDGIARYWFD